MIILNLFIHRKSLLLLLSTVLINAVAHSQDIDTGFKSTIAILTFEPRAGVSASEAEMISDRFATEFDKLNKYIIVARSKMREI